MAISTKIKKYIENKQAASRRAYVNKKRYQSSSRLTSRRTYHGTFVPVPLPTALDRPMPASVRMKFYYSKMLMLSPGVTGTVI